jgi:large subunit ribosomal protein L30
MIEFHRFSFISRVFMEKNSLESKLVAIVRVRGRVNVRHDISETLKRLRLNRVNNCTVVKLTPDYYGMLKNCESYVTYGEISKDTLERLVKNSRLKISASDIIEGKYDAKEFKKSLPFRLHPPRHGYKSTKRSVNEGGSLGYMGPKINNLIQRMVK